MRQPTLTDVARHAGVSYATADRVINRRGNVAEKSMRKVEDAVLALGYVRNVAAANLSKGRAYRFAFVLPSGSNAFYRRMQEHITAANESQRLDRVSVEIQEVEAFEVEALSDHLHSLADASFDGIAVVGLDRKGLEAPLAKLRHQGLAVVSLVSDLATNQRDVYVGIDNHMAGRTAARLMGLAHGDRAGLIQVVAGSLDASDHSERFTGFCDVIAADYPNITLQPLIEAKDDPDLVYNQISQVCRQTPDLTAIYNIGAGNKGIIRVLEADLDLNLLCIVHELVDHSRDALERGLFDVVIDQRPDVEITRAIAIMRALSDQRPPPAAPDLLPTIYVKDNLPSVQDGSQT